MKRQVLVIENDLTICKAIYDHLQDNLTDVFCVTSTAETLADHIEKDYCLVIIDVQPSDVNEMDLLQTIRLLKHMPILALTTAISTEEEIALLHAGVDAYIKKPINMQVCKAQANALIKLYIESDINHNQYKPVIHGSEFMISPRYRQVMIDGKPLTLTRREFDLLHCLASSPKQVFTCEQLYEHVWGDDSAVAVDDIVKSQIKRLRKKLSQIGKDYIQTEWGVGYKFVLSDC